MGKQRQSKAGLGARRSSRAGPSAHKVRIIGGAWKRTPIPVPELDGLRPTPDRVRETLFNWLGFLRPDLSDVTGLDMFAGTGALGFELASRGAAHVVLIEREPTLVDQYESLRSKLGATDRIEIISADALAAAARFADASFDVLFLDPPFGSDLLAPALAQASRLVRGNGLIYVEWDEPLDEALLAGNGLRVLRVARAGRVAFHLLAHANEE